MNLIKTTICLLLVASLLLATACTGTNDSNETTSLIIQGRYVEVDISPPIDGTFMTFMSHDGNLVAFDQGLTNRYTSTDVGQNWTQSPGPGVNYPERFEFIQAASLMPCGSLLVFVFEEGLFQISPDNTMTPFPIARIDEAIGSGEYSVFISMMHVLGDDRLLLDYSISGFMPMRFSDTSEDDDGENENDENENDEDSNLANRVMGMGMGSRFDQHTALYELSTGNLVLELFSGETNATSAVARGENFYLLHAWENRINSFDMASGAPISGGGIALASSDNMNMGFRGMGGGNMLAVDNEGNLLVMHDRNLIRFTGNDSYTLLDGNSFSFGAPNAAVSNVMTHEDTIIISVMDGMDTALFQYVWDENAVINPERTLHIWSLENNDMVRAAMTEMRRRYPDTYFTYEVALTEGTGMSASDAVRTLNTRLLSNSGPDIIILDGTPLDSYINRGMLMDLSSYVNTEGMYQNLLAPFVQDNGAIYTIPTQIRIPLIVGDIDAVTSIGNLDNFVDRIVSGNRQGAQVVIDDESGWFAGVPEDERAEFDFNDLRELYDILWSVNSPAIINNNQLDSDALESFLSAMVAISDMYDLADPDSDMEMGFGMVAVSGGGRASVISGSLMQYLSNSTNMGAFYLENTMVMQMLFHRESRGNTDVELFPGMLPGVWLPSTMVGVSADTAVTDFAMEFVNAMLSTEVQRIDYGEGLPITPAGLNGQIQEMNDRLIEWGADPIEIDLGPVIARLQTPAIIENVVTEIIWETAERLSYGRIDLEGAVMEIEQNIRNYLAERS